jgi:hypothetical protein
MLHLVCFGSSNYASSCLFIERSIDTPFFFFFQRGATKPVNISTRSPRAAEKQKEDLRVSVVLQTSNP